MVLPHFVEKHLFIHYQTDSLKQVSAQNQVHPVPLWMFESSDEKFKWENLDQCGSLFNDICTNFFAVEVLENQKKTKHFKNWTESWKLDANIDKR